MRIGGQKKKNLKFKIDMAYIEYILEYGTKKMEWIDTVEVTLGSWQNKNLPNLFLLQRFRQKGFC
ncbi:MAG: hypothetical protein ACK559_21590, partial [bacterium]